MKTCRKCSTEKSLDDFYKQKTSSDGHGAYCKECNKNEVKKYVRDNPEKSKDSWTKGRFMYRYGIRLGDDLWHSLIAKREDGCAICGSRTKLVIDHCHKTSAIRGVLCHTCNIGLGMFHDDPDKLANAISYLHSPPFGEGLV